LAQVGSTGTALQFHCNYSNCAAAGSLSRCKRAPLPLVSSSALFIELLVVLLHHQLHAFRIKKHRDAAFN
jgi:hypothetical protein